MSADLNQTMVFKHKPVISSRFSIVGVKEGEGPLGNWFDVIAQDDLLGQSSWEIAESEMQRQCVTGCIARRDLAPEDISVLLAGDLNAQLMASGLAARELKTPYFGLYGACSTYVEGLLLGAVLVDGGYRENAVCCASSHFCTAERQFRFPLELGTQRPPAASWTATAAGSCLIEPKGKGVKIVSGTVGRVIDYAMTDANHMGAAMAPAVFDAIASHLSDTGTKAEDYDLIATGDLGYIGRNILIELFHRADISMPEERLIDCGASLYSKEQDAHAGGSGCGCVASVTSGMILKKMEDGEIKRALITGSGALLSPTSQMQAESIPGIAYTVSLEG